jgi:hypothetical protein
MGQLDRSKLLQKEVLQIEKVELGEDEFVYVRQMTGHERDTFEQSLIKEKKDSKGTITGYDRATSDFRAKLAVVTICDENGNLLLQPGDYPALSANMSAKTLEKIINTAQKLNSITEEDKENLVKNSEAGLVEGSSSGSVEN